MLAPNFRAKKLKFGNLGKFGAAPKIRVSIDNTLKYDDSFSCKKSFIIYKIKCNLCSLEYIGETANPLHIRINGHRNAIKHPNLDNNFVEHIFIKHYMDHDFKDIQIDILNHTYNDNLLNLEKDQIINYKTIFPYGLNSKLKFNDISKYIDKICVYNKFKDISNKPKVNNTIANFNFPFNYNKHIDFIKLFDIWNNNYITINEITIIHLRLKNSKLKHMINNIINNYKFNKDKYFIPLIIKDIYKYKNNINIIPTNTDIICYFKFTNKIFDDINLTTIFNNAKSFLPINNNYQFKIQYNYNPNIGTLICNYNKFIKDCY